MTTIGRIKGISGNTLMIEVDHIEDLPIDIDLDITIKKHSVKRSLNANSYFHVLVDKLRQVLNISFAACKNELITSYGQIEYLDGDAPIIYKTNAPPEYVRELEDPHLKLFRTDLDAFWYRVYRGSHTYDTAEMAKLIDGTVEECKLQGIETLTPDELARLEGYGY